LHHSPTRRREVRSSSPPLLLEEAEDGSAICKKSHLLFLYAEYSYISHTSRVDRSIDHRSISMYDVNPNSFLCLCYYESGFSLTIPIVRVMNAFVCQVRICDFYRFQALEGTREQFAVALEWLMVVQNTRDINRQ
jgi:hypothetical protein